MRERFVSGDFSSQEFNLENKIKSAGGFGRYQIMVTIVATILRNSGMCWHYSFSYLTMQQQYICSFEGSPSLVPCTVDQICAARDNPVETGLFSYEADTSYAYYLNNWIENMDLTCINRSKIASVASMTFFGFALSGFLFFSIPDKYGRRLPLIKFMVFHFCV